MTSPYPKTGILVEAESFSYYGGWVLDSQFELEMGSPYLLAHGNGIPVADARTVMTVPKGDEGTYNVWVRAKDWVPEHHPGKFQLVINDATLPVEFGANDKDWNWQYGAQVKLRAGKTRLTLHDLTGFCGRCDAIFFSKEAQSPPNEVNAQSRAWRRKFRGIPYEPVNAGTFDVVVIGGGVVGAAAAITAARLGDRVALVHNSAYLGGNASVEVGLRPRGVRGALVEEVSDRHANGDIKARSLLEAEPTAALFLEHTVYNASLENSTIKSIDARHARSGREIRFHAPLFIDCSGRATLAPYTGAATLSGQESRAEYNEPLAPITRDESHHGNTVFFRTRMSSTPTPPFPSVPWATSVAQDFSNLSGQLIKPGIENGEGPIAVTIGQTDDPKARKRMKLPNTHYWEYGQYLDPYTQGEHIRDHLLRAIYGTFSNVKALEPEKYASLVLDWVAFVAATGEFQRYKGAHVLSETDIRAHRRFPDAVVQNDGAFCLHYPYAPKDVDPQAHRYDFRLRDWEWDERDHKPYDVPLRCLYSVNVANLMMAGKHVSATHVAVSNMKFMGNGSQHAVACAATSYVSRRYGLLPRDVAQKKELLDKVREICGRIERGEPPKSVNVKSLL
jgi:hypothetical protein